jgi:hypothetical protein
MGLTSSSDAMQAANHCASQRSTRRLLPPRWPGPPAIEVAWSAQPQLHQRWQHLNGEHKKSAGVVAIAVAPEFARFVWEIATLE